MHKTKANYAKLRRSTDIRHLLLEVGAANEAVQRQRAVNRRVLLNLGGVRDVLISAVKSARVRVQVKDSTDL